MDSADSEQIHYTLACQSAVIDQHGNRLEDVQETLKTILDQGALCIRGPPAQWRLQGLKCVCQLCTNNTCETGTDGACWNSVMLIDGKEEAVKSCLSPSQMKGQVFCYSSRNVSKRNCCFTDFCNNETLHLYPGLFLLSLSAAPRTCPVFLRGPCACS
ncbi:hypothetical protein SKAU_G00237330 [Synaphobranchus kaupii]|uniref:Activin types I and II receptor domain-containing protein n=1 Tax=Synaphobranchus kaupii TaxID=118154 RepID=A0A9Q1ITI9_SYNKA|nr:hypothetical protein SKAU_G00237330 [Synaphobranchus kaupii]